MATLVGEPQTCREDRISERPVLTHHTRYSYSGLSEKEKQMISYVWDPHVVFATNPGRINAKLVAQENAPGTYM